jgi:hypothetical protein
MKKLIMFACVFFSFTAGLLAEDRPPAFAGSWILDPEKSDPQPYPLTEGPPIRRSSPSVADAAKTVPPNERIAGESQHDYYERIVRQALNPTPPYVGTGPSPNVVRTSDAKPEQSGVQRLILEQVGNNDWKLSGVKIIEGKNILFSEILNCDSTLHVDMVQVPDSLDKIKQSTTAALKKNKIQMERIFYYPQETVKNKLIFSLSSDGQTLTFRTESSSNRKMMEIQTQVFHRQ